MDTIKALLKRYAHELPPLENYPLTLCRFKRGEMLACAGEPITRLCFLLDGVANVYNVMENGRSALHTRYEGVQAIGDLELLMDYPTLTSDVQAVTDGVMLRIELDGSRERLLTDAAVLRFLGREVAQKLERSSRYAMQNGLYPLANRLAAYLLFAADNGVFREHLTRTSEMMGVSYRHLLRTLREFSDKGWIAREEHGYRLLREDELQKLGSPLRYD